MTMSLLPNHYPEVAVAAAEAAMAVIPDAGERARMRVCACARTSTYVRVCVRESVASARANIAVLLKNDGCDIPTTHSPILWS